MTTMRFGGIAGPDDQKAERDKYMGVSTSLFHCQSSARAMDDERAGIKPPQVDAARELQA